MQMPAAVESVVVDGSEGQSESQLQSEEHPSVGGGFDLSRLWLSNYG